jgi:hypothetical protein
MLENSEAEVARIGVRLIDDAYMAWFEAENEAEGLLRAWFQSTGERHEVAYLSYRAALEREEASARDLERLWGMASTCRQRSIEQSEKVAE